MNRRIVSILLVLTVTALVGVPGALATPEFYGVLQSIYGGPTTCQLDCHTSTSGPPPFTAYGTAFAAQPNFSDVAGGGTAAALIAIGPPVTSIQVTPATKTLDIGQNQTFTAALFDNFSNQLTNNVSVNWTSSNTTVGTVDLKTGMFTAIEAGTTIVTASDGGIGSGPVSGNATVTVSAPTATPTETVNVTATPTETVNVTATPTETVNVTATPTETVNVTATPTATANVTMTGTPVETVTGTAIATATGTPTPPTAVPEFPTLVLPVAGIMALAMLLLYQRRRDK